MTDETLADDSVQLVHRWIESARRSRGRTDPAATRLAHLLKDPHGLDFTIGFVDRVVRPEDPRVAAHNLRLLAADVPAFLPWHQRFLLRLGAVFSTIFPELVVGTARRTLRRMVGHLVADARPDQLTRSIKKLRSGGDRLNLNLLGEAVLGEAEAARRLAGTLAMLERDDVDYVSVKVSSVASQLSLWAFDQTVTRVAQELRPLYEVAASSATPKFINLDMEEYHDLDLTIAVFTRVLEHFPDLEAGIVLQAYLPDALGAMQRLQDWAARRREQGGARIKVRVVKGANLAMERVDATMHTWPLATFATKQETDTSYKRVLRWSLTPARVDAVRIGVAGQNLFDVAYAWLLAGQRNVRDGVDFEMLLGMATGPTAAVRETIGNLLLYTPVVHPDEFDVAISYLVRRLEENASPDNFMSAAFELGADPALFEREEMRFRAAVAALPWGLELQAEDPSASDVPTPHRVQNRSQDLLPMQRGQFANVADTDPSLAANRAWGRAALRRSTYTQLGLKTVGDAGVPGPASLETLVQRTRRAGVAWGRRDAELRAWILHQCAVSLDSKRAELVSVMAAETGKTIHEADVEVSEAVDFANYYAEAARRLEVVDGAQFTPSALTVVTPPWNFPVAIPAGSVLAALAAGSGVIIKPAPQSQRCAAVMVEALWEGGVPQDVLRYAIVEEGPLGKALVAHSAVDRVILTGAWETAELFRSWRPDLPLLAETSGKNAIVVTPSADLDLAVADLVNSAFSHAGQKCSAASLGILVGSVATSERFRRQLVDAVTSMRVGYPDDPETRVGPVVEVPTGKLRDALTTLDEGEAWLVEPRSLDESGRLWSPGVKTGVTPGSRTHLTEFFGPVLGLMVAPDLATAIEWQNATDYGLTAGLHSLDADEVSAWVDSVEAGNLYVNRGITGAVVQRQPFGGWKRSSVGVTAKAGGPNYLTHLGSWTKRPLRPGSASTELLPEVRDLLERASGLLGAAELAHVTAAARSDQHAYDREFGVAKDVSGLGVERNVFRYLPAQVTVRLHRDGHLVDLVRVLCAGLRSGAEVTVSVHPGVGEDVRRTVAPDALVQDDDAWHAGVAAVLPSRVRLVGGDAHELAEAVGGHPDVAVHAGEVTWAGRLELLPFLHEQAVSITNHRFGNHDATFDHLLPRRG